MNKMIGFGAIIAIIVSVFVIIPIGVIIAIGFLRGFMWSVNSTPIGWLALVLALICLIIVINHNTKERKQRGW